MSWYDDIKVGICSVCQGRANVAPARSDTRLEDLIMPHRAFGKWCEGEFTIPETIIKTAQPSDDQEAFERENEWNLDDFPPE